MKKILIVAPSLDVKTNVSGMSAVASFIVANNRACQYEHFLQGKSDGEKGPHNRVLRVLKNYGTWKQKLKSMDDSTVIHFNFSTDTPGILRDYFFLRTAYQQDKKMIVHLHGGLYLFQEKKPFVIRWMLSGIFRMDVPFIALSEKEKRQLENKYGVKQVVVLPNCVDLSEAAADTTKNYTGRLDLLYMGRIEPDKGMDYLYEAMAAWKETADDLCLHFAGIEQGGGGYVEKFRQLLGCRFVYEGVVSGHRKTELLRQCQVFLLPSFYEGLPMSLLECMSFGQVPVVTDVGSICEYVTDRVNGLVVKVKDADSITEAVKLLLHDRLLLEKMSGAARQTVFERLRSEDYISKLNHLYASLG